MKTTADESEDAFSGETVPLAAEGSDKTKSVVLASSRKQYAVPKNTVEKYLEKLFENPRRGNPNPPKQPKPRRMQKTANPNDMEPDTQ